MSDTPLIDETSQVALAASGIRMQAFLNRLPVETNWMAGHQIVWQFGQQNGSDGAGPENHRHCNALVAAIALDLDIHVLRPAHHAQKLLANEQSAWLGGNNHLGPSAAASGWRDLGRRSERGQARARRLSPAACYGPGDQAACQQA